MLHTLDRDGFEIVKYLDEGNHVDIALVQVGKLFHVVRIDWDRHQVQSCLHVDCSQGTLVSHYGTAHAIKYVSKGRTRKAALQAYRREYGKYEAEEAALEAYRQSDDHKEFRRREQEEFEAKRAEAMFQ